MDNKIKDILDYAIGKEAEAAFCYEQASESAKSPVTKQIFKEMAAMERGHKQKLEKISQEAINKYVFEDVADLKIGDYMVDKAFKPNMPYGEILVLAIKNEEKARDLYNCIAKKCAEPDTKKVFEILAQEESKHKLDLESEYDEDILVEN